MLSPQTILIVVGGYFLLLMAMSFLTSKKGSDSDFFIAGKSSPWYLVAFGMIGATLSGVTFISIPGAIGNVGVDGALDGTNAQFSYMQVVFGYLVGYFIIATVLMPMYYKLNLTSIYGYLGQRFGNSSHKTGSAFFLLSRIIGASFRLFLVAIVLQKFVMDAFNIPFFVTVMIIIILIWVYTFRGGIKTIVVTDAIQTTCMLLAVVLTIGAIVSALGITWGEIPDTIRQSELGRWFYFDTNWNSDSNFFWKQFLSGAALATVMTGLDQDMMQKNLSCRNIGDAQKNMFWFSIILFFVKLLFLVLGALLYIYAAEKGIEVPGRRDQFYPIMALENLTPVIGIVFILGLIAAAYSSADSALTSLTTVFCVDFLGFEKRADTPDKRKLRYMVHVGFSIVLLAVIMIFWNIDDESVINKMFRWAGYTYGPLLGLFAFGFIWKRRLRDPLVPIVCILAPILSIIINNNSKEWFNYTFGFEILIFNGLLTFIGLYLIGINQSPKSLDPVLD